MLLIYIMFLIFISQAWLCFSFPLVDVLANTYVHILTFWQISVIATGQSLFKVAHTLIKLSTVMIFLTMMYTTCWGSCVVFQIIFSSNVY